MGKTNEPLTPQDRVTIMESESWVGPMVDAKPHNAALEALIALRGEAHARLLENQDYRTLVALDRAIQEITGEKPVADVVADHPKPKPKVNGDASVQGLSQADAAQVLLNQVLNEPVPIARLVSALNAHGVSVGGANPNINLSSVLSKDGRFRSVRYKERSCWWVKGRPFPGELDAQ